MDCKSVIKEIDRLVFEPNHVSHESIMRHLGSCPACSEYYRASLPAVRVMAELHWKEPVLSDPEKLTEDIMNEVSKYPGKIPGQEHWYSSTRKSIFILQRLLAAASVLLVIVLGIEQYVYLEKLRKLEQHNALAAKNVQNLSLVQLSSILETLSPDKKADKEIIDWKSPGKNQARLILLVSMAKNIETTYPDLFRIVPSGKTKQASSAGIVLNYFDEKSQNIKK